ncbi:MAG: WGR domain-containing protein [Terracidiphilus sp.]
MTRRSVGRFRAYRLEAGTDLFGDWMIDITYGRIGTKGRRIRYALLNEAQAKKLVCETLRRRATARKCIGVPYSFCQLIDTYQWFPVTLRPGI